MAHTIMSLFFLLCFTHIDLCAMQDWNIVYQLQEQGAVQDAVVLAHALHKKSSGFSFLVQEKEIQSMRDALGMNHYQSSWYFLWAYCISWMWWLFIVVSLCGLLFFILFRYKKISTRHLFIFCVSSGMFFVGFVQKYRLSTVSQGIVTEKNCSIQGGPDETYLSIGRMEYGEIVTIKQDQGKYLFVQAGQQKGWVVKDHIKNI